MMVADRSRLQNAARAIDHVGIGDATFVARSRRLAVRQHRLTKNPRAFEHEPAKPATEVPGILRVPMQTPLPSLYSFRRCPYAMRARLALDVSSQAFDVIEVALRDK